MTERCVDNAESHCKSYPNCCGCNSFRKPTNYDRIRNMSVEEMAKIIPKFLMAHLNKYGKALGLDEVIPTKDEMKETEKEWKQWLEREVDNDVT